MGNADDNGRVPNDEGDQPYDDDVAVASGKHAPGTLINEPLCEQAEVDKEAAMWSKLSNSNDEYKNIDFGDVNNFDIRAIKGIDIVEAAKTFPVSTGLGADNFAPRAVCRLPEETLEHLAMIMNAAEELGT